MNLHKMIEICLKDDNMHIFVMINALICINNYVITCINSMLSDSSPTFREQPVEREKTSFFYQMTARVCGGVPSPLLEPKIGREGKGPT